MIRLASVLLVMTFSVVSIWAQGKGVDRTGERVRDSGTAGSNGVKNDTGAGRGIDFGKGRTAEVPPLPNPYRLASRRDVILNAVAEVMRDRKLIMDEGASKPAEGIVVSQPYTFIKGGVITQSELGRYSDITTSTACGWNRGRYTITVEVQPIDGNSANVSVNAKIEGRRACDSGPEWITLRSSGLVEEEFLSALVTGITGGPPPGRVE